VPGDPRGQKAGEIRGDRGGGRRDAVPGSPGAYSLGQRPGVRGEGVAEVAVKCRDGNAVHRAGQPLGERILRELQREAARRMLEWRDLLLAEGGTDRDRTVEGGVQHAAAALGARIQAADTGACIAVPPNPISQLMVMI